MIREKLKKLNSKEKADKKAEEIALLDHIGFFNDGDYRVEILSCEKIDGGIKLRARAWKNDIPVGFMDGSVEIETFRIFNPPILVDTPDGDIQIDNIDRITGERTTRKLKEDPIAAVRKSLVHTIGLVGKVGSNIQKGKIGTTVSTFYSGSGDGYSAIWESTSSWATVHDALTGNDTSATGTNFYAGISQHQTTGSKTTIGRMFLPFDTAAIPDTDTVTAATLTVYSTGTTFNGDNDGDDFVTVVQTSQASNTTLAHADYDTCGDAISNPTEGATRIDLSSWSTGAGNANTFTLNSTGLGWISKTGYTKLGLREGHDVINSQIANNTVNGAAVYLSEQDGAGTTNDPTLTVTHGGVVKMMALLGIG